MDQELLTYGKQFLITSLLFVKYVVSKWYHKATHTVYKPRGQQYIPAVNLALGKHLCITNESFAGSVTHHLKNFTEVPKTVFELKQNKTNQNKKTIMYIK